MKKIGSNWLVLIGAIVVGGLAFIAAIAVGNAQKPSTVSVLAVTRDLNVGDVIQATDLTTVNVYKDASTSYYIPADQRVTLVGGWVAIPVLSGQPVARQNIIASAGIGERLSASLAKWGADYRLFTIPLDATNIVSPGIDAFMPGDLIGITMSISQHPQEPSTPTPTPGGPVAESTPVSISTPPMNQSQANADNRIYPPFAADLFPGGLRVIATYGKSTAVQAVPTASSGTSSMYQTSSSGVNQPTYIIVLVPQDKVEELSFALMSSDKVYISLMAVGSNTPTTSFSYWDLEDLLKSQRDQVLGGGKK